MNIYIGKIAYEATDEDLRQAFEAYGEVSSATVIMDRYSGRSRGFGFVEMANDDEANAAIEGLNGSELRGRPIVVNESRPREPRGPRSGGYGGGGGGPRY